MNWPFRQPEWSWISERSCEKTRLLGLGQSCRIYRSWVHYDPSKTTATLQTTWYYSSLGGFILWTIFRRIPTISWVVFSFDMQPFHQCSSVKESFGTASLHINAFKRPYRLTVWWTLEMGTLLASVRLKGLKIPSLVCKSDSDGFLMLFLKTLNLGGPFWSRDGRCSRSLAQR